MMVVEQKEFYPEMNSASLFRNCLLALGVGGGFGNGGIFLVVTMSRGSC